jgi:outer membrane receptor protein involved in Fe transport
MGAALGALLPAFILAPPVLAQEQTVAFDIPAQPLSGALNAYARTARRQILFSDQVVQGRPSAGLQGRYEPTAALERLLDGSGLTWRRSAGGALLIERAVVVSPQTAAAAVNASAEAAFVEELVVTGTHLRGGARTAPVTRIDRAEFEQAGFLDAGQALRSLPTNFAGGLNTESLAAGGATIDRTNRTTPGQSSANLRALGSGATLVLINGHRVPPIGYGISPDLSLTPAAAIERVEVLADGASAVYGADAVAGVVNIITRRRIDGVEARARFGGAGGGLETTVASLTAGGAMAGVEVAVGGEYYHQDRLFARKRDRSRAAGEPTTLFGETERSSAFASVTAPLGENVRLLLDGLYMNRTLDGSIFTRLDTRQRFYSQAKAAQYAVSATLEADLSADWRVELVGTLSENLAKETSRTTTLVDVPVRAQLSRFENQLWSAEARVTGRPVTLPAGRANLALGVAYREEDSDQRITTPVTLHRQVRSAYAELDLPLLGGGFSPGGQRLNLVSALRHEDYSDFGAVTVPKVGLTWGPIDGLDVRASYSKSFRAPAAIDLQQSFFVIYSNAQDTTGSTRIVYLSGSGAALEPERAKNFNVGITFQPPRLPGLRVGLDYFRIDYTNRIEPPDTGTVFPFDIRNAPAVLVTRNPTPEQVTAAITGAFNVIPLQGAALPINPAQVRAIVDARLRNISRTEIEGLSAQVSYETDLFGGVASAGVDANYFIRFEDQLQPQSPVRQRTDTIFSPPDLRARANLQWRGERWSFAAYANYTDDYLDNRTATPVKVRSWTTFDGSATYQLGGGLGGLRDSRLILSATNLFDKAPPEIVRGQAPRESYRWDGTNASIVGRFVSLEFVGKW